MEGKIVEFVHPELNVPVVAIGGNYVFTREERFSFNDRSILYYVGVATFDTTCCGAGGCAYAFVPGFIAQWKIGKSDDGQPISRIELVKDPKDQKEIQSLIAKKQIVNQVNFHV